MSMNPDRIWKTWIQTTLHLLGKVVLRCNFFHQSNDKLTVLECKVVWNCGECIAWRGRPEMLNQQESHVRKEDQLQDEAEIR